MYDMISDSAAKAVTAWIANNAAKSDKYKIKGMSVTFRAVASYGIFGIVSTAVGIGAAFIPELIARIVFMAVFGLLGILIMLYGFVMQLTLDPERITYRGPLGLKRQILWRDVQSITVVSAENPDLMIRSRNGRIRVFGYLAGFNDIKKLLLSRSPASFDTETALDTGDSNLLQKEYGAHVFKLKKLSVILGFIMILFALSGVVYSHLVYRQTDITLFAAIPAVIVGGLLMLMYGFVTRLYIRDDRLVYRTFFFHEKSMLWEDITSVLVSGEPQHELIIIESKKAPLWEESVFVSDVRRHKRAKARSKTTRIKIRIDFKGYPLLKALILKRCPDSASVSVESLAPLKPL